MKPGLCLSIFIFCSFPASAIQCVYVIQKGSADPTLPVAGYDLVFAGTVTKRQQVIREDGKKRLLERIEATFEVEKVWYGTEGADGTVVISSRFNPIAHDKGFKVGQRRVVLAKKIDGLLVSPACSPPRGGYEDEKSLVERIESEYGENG